MEGLRINLRQLAVFDAVAKHESVSRGSAEVGLSQPAASMALKELEAELGVELFHRQGRRLSLNENGRRLHPIVRSLLLQAREVQGFQHPDQLSGVLRIAATRTMADYVLAQLCTAFLEANPLVRIQLEQASWDHVLDAVENNRSDLGFVQAPCNRPALVFEPLMTDRVTIFSAPQHPLAKEQPLTKEQLAGARWCLRGTGSTTRSMLTFALTEVEPVLSIAFESNSNEALMHAVKSGIGLGCLSDRALKNEFATGALVPLETTDLAQDFNRLFGIIRPVQAYRGALQESFASFAVEMADKL